MPKENDVTTVSGAVAGAKENISALDIAADALHEVNMTLAGMISSDPGFNVIEQKRDELDARFKRLVREAFKDNTAIFVKAGSDLEKVNARMKKDIQGLKNLQNVIDSITDVIKALDGFIEAAFPLPG